MQNSSYTNVVLLVLHLKLYKFNLSLALAWISCPDSHRFVSNWGKNYFIPCKSKYVTGFIIIIIIIIIIVFVFEDGLIAQRF
jgi:hypothetical protein